MIDTSPTDLERIDRMFNKMTPLLGYLYQRWLDERKYEGLADYGGVISKSLPGEFTLEAVRTRPFGFWFSIGTDAKYEMSCNGRQISWKRIK